MMVTVDLAMVHASGRYNASVSDVVAYLKGIDHEEPFDLATMTEAHQRGLVKGIRKAFPRHEVVKSGAALWIYRSSPKLERQSGRGARRRTITHVKGFPGWRQTRVGVLWFTVPALGVRLRSLLSHLPAGVESGNSWRRGGRQTRLAVRCHQAATNALARVLDETPWVVQALHMDTNVNYRRDRWRNHMRLDLEAPDVWGTRPPARGSLNGRLIDAAHVTHTTPAVKVTTSRGRVSKAKKPRSMDHRAIRYTLTLQGA